MAINTSLPTRLLLDNTVLPSTKVLYCILDYLSNDQGQVHYNRNKMMEMLTYVSEAGSRTLSVDEVESAINFLDEAGYISVDKATIFMYNNVVITKEDLPKKGPSISEDAKEVQEYHMDSSIIRGYRKTKTVSKSDLEIIQRYLNQGYKKEDLIGYINHHFERDWIKKNTDFARISTAFRKKVFDDQYPYYQDNPQLRGMVITAFGLSSPTQEVTTEDNEGKNAEWM